MTRFYEKDVSYWDLDKKKYIPEEKYRTLIHLGMTPEEIYKDYAQYYENVKKDPAIETREQYKKFLRDFLKEKICEAEESNKVYEKERWTIFVRKMLNVYDMGQSHKKKFVFENMTEILTKKV